jgi:hypothetical protein
MALTLFIQAFGSFYVGIGFCRTNIERGIAGITGAIIATSANPAVGLAVGIILGVILEYVNTKKAERAQYAVEGLEDTLKELEPAREELAKLENVKELVK